MSKVCAVEVTWKKNSWMSMGARAPVYSYTWRHQRGTSTPAYISEIISMMWHFSGFALDAFSSSF